MPDCSSINLHVYIRTAAVNPGVNDVYKFLKSRSSKWNEIGGGLGIRLNFRESLIQEGHTRSNDSKLELILHKWTESHCSEVSWDNLISVLDGLELGDVADKIESWLTTDATAKRKYHWSGSRHSRQEVNSGGNLVRCMSSAKFC